MRISDLITMQEAREGTKNCPRSLAHRVGEAQNWRCAYCQRTMTLEPRRDHTMTMDHVIPRSRGGRYSYLNCVAACSRCNHWRGTIDALLYYQHAQLHKQMTRELRKHLTRQSKPMHSKLWLDLERAQNNSGSPFSKNPPLKRLYYTDGSAIKTWEDLNPNIHDRP